MRRLPQALYDADSSKDRQYPEVDLEILPVTQTAPNVLLET
jgi:hypothetical protein